MKVGEPKRLLAGMLFLVLIAGVATPAFAMPPSDAVIVSTPAAVFTFTFPDALEPTVPALLPLGPPFGPTPLPPMPGTNQIIVFNEPANEGGGISDILVQTTNLNVCSTGICFVSDDDQAALQALLASLITTLNQSPVFVDETGAQQDQTALLQVAPGFTVSVESDIVVGTNGGKAVGGAIMPIDMVSLFVAGAMTNAFWVLPTFGGIAGAALTLFKLKRKTRVD